MPLPGAPREEVVRAHGHLETGALGVLDVGQQLTGADLLVRGVEADPGHARPSGGGVGEGRRGPVTGWTADPAAAAAPSARRSRRAGP
ncbi:hypothetical protein [Ornithinimicrobium kibberense]|uniref:hypothetical protein n=1 Tax=Ornithinimicrobium kibberense TaxID=282060 RepID=UPI0036122412